MPEKLCTPNKIVCYIMSKVIKIQILWDAQMCA